MYNKPSAVICCSHVLFFISVFFTFPLSAQDTAESLPDEFVKNIRQAFESQVHDDYWNLLHPSTRACYTQDQHKIFLEGGRFADDFNYASVDPSYALKEAKKNAYERYILALGVSEAAFSQQQYPTHVLTIDYPEAKIYHRSTACGTFRGEKTVVFNLIEEAGTWYIVDPCLDEERLKKIKQRNDQSAQSGKVLLESMNKAQLADLKDRISQTTRIDVIQYLAETYSIDFSTAQTVLHEYCLKN